MFKIKSAKWNIKQKEKRIKRDNKKAYSSVMYSINHLYRYDSITFKDTEIEFEIVRSLFSKIVKKGYYVEYGYDSGYVIIIISIRPIYELPEYIQEAVKNYEELNPVEIKYVDI